MRRAASTGDAYAAMNWLRARQAAIEKKLARRHLAPDANPQPIATFDLSTSWLVDVALAGATN